jgi:hypothetical protein
MPEKATRERPRRDRREGKAPTTQAGEFVREEIEHVREGKHGARSTKQAIAIGLSNARRAGVRLKSPRASASVRGVRPPATRARDGAAGRRSRRPGAHARRCARSSERAGRLPRGGRCPSTRETARVGAVASSAGAQRAAVALRYQRNLAMRPGERCGRALQPRADRSRKMCPGVGSNPGARRAWERRKRLTASGYVAGRFPPYASLGP